MSNDKNETASYLISSSTGVSDGSVAGDMGQQDYELRHQKPSVPSRADDGTGLLIIGAIFGLLIVLALVTAIVRLWMIGTIPYLWLYEYVAEVPRAGRFALALLFLASQAIFIAAIIWLANSSRKLLLGLAALPYANVLIWLLGWQVTEHSSIANGLRDTLLKTSLFIADSERYPKYSYGSSIEGYADFADVSWQAMETYIAEGFVGLALVAIVVASFVGFVRLLDHFGFLDSALRFLRVLIAISIVSMVFGVIAFILHYICTSFIEGFDLSALIGFDPFERTPQDLADLLYAVFLTGASIVLPLWIANRIYIWARRRRASFSN